MNALLHFVHVNLTHLLQLNFCLIDMYVYSWYVSINADFLRQVDYLKPSDNSRQC